MPVVNRGQDRLHTPPTLFPDFLRQSLSGHPSCEPASQWLKAFMRQGPNCLPLALKSLPQMQVKCENQLGKILGKAPLCTGRQTREVNPRGFFYSVCKALGVASAWLCLAAVPCITSLQGLLSHLPLSECGLQKNTPIGPSFDSFI